MSLLHAQAPVPMLASQRADHLVVPFSLSLAPIARLALLDFNGDATYRGLEVQRIVDPGGAGEGTVVLMARRDGTTDVYFEPHLELDRAGYEWVGNGLAGWFPTAMDSAEFEITTAGLQLDVSFPLEDRRRLQLLISERRRNGGSGFTLLAPAGSASATPTFLPVFWLPNVRFVRRRGASNVDIRIAGEARPLVKAPIPWRRARYCAAPALGVWNEQHDGPLTAVPAVAGEHAVPDATVEVTPGAGGPALHAITATCGRRRLAVVHEPPVPDLQAISDGALLKGSVSVRVDGADLFGGCYRLRRRGDSVDVEVDVTRPWQPRDQNLAGAVLFRVLAFFRTWPTTYRWRASVDLSPDVPVMTSRWERKRR